MAPSIDHLFSPRAALVSRCLDWLHRDPARNCIPIGAFAAALADLPRLTSLYLAVSYADDGSIAALAWRSLHHTHAGISASDPQALTFLAPTVRSDMPDLPAFAGPSEWTQPFLAGWLHPGEPHPRPGIPQTLYSTDHVLPHPPVPGDLHLAPASDLPTLARWWVQASSDMSLQSPSAAEAAAIVAQRAAMRTLWAWYHSGPVSMAAASGPPGRVAKIGPVYTPPQFRRHGYAGAATAALAQLLLDDGHPLVCLYTHTANATANHIYQQVGFQAICAVEEWWPNPPAKA